MGQGKGYAAVVAAAVLWGSSGTVGKGLFVGGLDVFDLIQARATLSALILAVVLGIFHRGFFRIRKRDWPMFAVLGGLCFALTQGTYLYAISKIQVAAAILLQYMAPILVAMFAILFWKERLTLAKVASVLMAATGCYLMVGGYDLKLLEMNRLGILSGLASAVGFAAYSLLGERAMHRYPPFTVLFYALIFSVVTLNIIHPPLNFLRVGYSAGQWGFVGYMAACGTILPFGFYFVGINYLRSTQAAVTATLEPISAGLMAFLWLGETLAFWQILGGGLVLGAVVWLQLKRETSDLAPAVVRTEASW